MPFFLDPLPWLILLPLFWATLAFLFGPRAGAPLGLATALAQLPLAWLLATEIARDGPRRYAIGGWGAPLGIELAADGLTAFMLLLAAAVTLAIMFYARSYFAASPRLATGFWPLAGFLVAALNALFLAADLFNLYVTLELLGLAAVALVAINGDAAAVTAALRYLLATLLGSGAYLMGVALLYGTYGTVSLELLVDLVQPTPANWLAAALMVLGMLLKTALFPFHVWLPPAHGGATPPVSALLSALVIKASFYLLLRLWFGPFQELITPAAAQALGWLGVGAILWGSLRALTQTRLKMLVAYSTVAQAGYLFLLFPLATATTPDVARLAIEGGVYQIAAHALAKAAMFAAAGAMVLAMGRDEIAGLHGAGARLSLSLTAFTLAGITLMGLPPTGGFIAKWLLLQAALASGQWWWIVVLIVGGLLAAAYVFKVLRQPFPPAAAADPAFRSPPLTLELAALVLASGALILGLWAEKPLALLDVGPLWETRP